MTFNEEHQTWDSGKGVRYKAVPLGGAWLVRRYSSMPLSDDDHTLIDEGETLHRTWREANEEARVASTNYGKNAR